MAYLVLFLSNILFGLNYPLVKELLDNARKYGLDTSSIVAFRQFLAVISFLTIAIIGKISLQIEKRHILYLIGGGVLGIFLNQYLFVWGQSMVDIFSSSIVVSLIPVFTYGIAVSFRLEKFDMRILLGVILGFASVVMLVLGETKTQIGGIILILINSVAYASYLVIIKKVREHISNTALSFWTFLVGFTPTMLINGGNFIKVNYATMELIHITGLLYFTFVVTVLGYYMVSWCLKYVDSSTVAIFTIIQPLIAGIFHILVKREKVTILDVVAFVCGAIAILMVAKKQNDKGRRQNPGV